jgi:hypothetical protein
MGYPRDAVIVLFAFSLGALFLARIINIPIRFQHHELLKIISIGTSAVRVFVSPGGKYIVLIRGCRSLSNFAEAFFESTAIMMISKRVIPSLTRGYI